MKYTFSVLQAMKVNHAVKPRWPARGCKCYIGQNKHIAVAKRFDNKLQIVGDVMTFEIYILRKFKVRPNIYSLLIQASAIRLSVYAP